ncbi:MAG: carboxypeptidase regulatory-like domain-containing protein [Thermoplasmata archaeon]|nr:carboxypeptidase regulatory-like domain-containing protein [Thermoplasmata archaeon]
MREPVFQNRSPPARRLVMSAGLALLALLVSTPTGLGSPHRDALLVPPHHPELSADRLPATRPLPVDSVGSSSGPELLAGTRTLHERFENVGGLLPTGSGTAPVHPHLLTPTAAPKHAPAPGYTGSGTIHGTVLDSYFGTPVANVSITIVPLSGFGCLPTPCGGTTDRFGAFTVNAPVGGDVVSLSKPFYLDNRTWTTVANGSSVSVGTIDLVHDGYATGRLEANLPGTPPIPGVPVNASSRDQLIVAEPGAVTAVNGSFTVPVPPLPSIVDFAPSGKFLANQTYVNATPYSVVSVGTVYLEGGVLVRAKLFDAITGVPIASSLLSQLQVCTRRDVSSCPFVVGTQSVPNGPNVSAYALAGPSYVEAMAYGYVVNQTAIPDVPLLPTSQTDNLGRINLMPMGALEVSTNLTGSSTLPTAWPSGNVTVVVCTLDNVMIGVPNPNSDGLLASPCWGPKYSAVAPMTNSYPVGATATVVGPPLRDVAFLEPDTGGGRPFVFPVATRPIMGIGYPYPESAANVTWVNLTPDRLTDYGGFDLTAGTYVDGNLSLLGGNASFLGASAVQVCSTDEPGVCAAPAGVGGASAPTGCPTGGLSFCAPAPPGPDELVVTTFGVGANRTWIEAPRGCCAQDGHPTAVGTIGVPSALPVGSVNGSVWAGPRPDGSPATPLSDRFVSVETCLIGPVPAGDYGSVCNSGATNLTDGTFSLTALVGWNQVTAYSGGFATNWTWIDVQASNTTGRIYLAPDAQVAGRVVRPDGAGVYAADVVTCALATLALCHPLGGGLTSSDGQYNGTLQGSPYPAGVYQVEASASGYASNWTWVNASSGALTVAPTIVLSPLGINQSARLTPRAGASRPAAAPGGGAWIDGRLVDRRTGLGLGGAVLTACPVTGGACLLSPDTTGFGGEFNTSLPFGAYHVYLNSSNHGNATAFANVSAASYLHLGTVAAAADPFVHGRVLLGPWPGITRKLGLGPLGAQVRICTASGSPCDSSVLADTGGFFNVSAPLGRSDAGLVIGTQQAYYGTADGGYEPLPLTVNASVPFVELIGGLAPAIVLPLFGSLSGDLRDGSSWKGTPARPDLPVMFASLYAMTNGATNGAALAETGGGGNFTVFMPSDGTSTFLAGLGAAFRDNSRNIAGSVVSGNGTGGWNLTLPHYGWITANLTGGIPLARLPYVAVTVSVPDPTNATTLYSYGISNGAGFVNVTAPPTASASVGFVLSGFANHSQKTAVSQSHTSPLLTVNLTNLSGGGAGAWVQSESVNTVGVPPTTTVVDSRTYSPVQGAQVSVTTSTGATTTPNLRTNALGQFMLLAPPDPYDTLSFQAPAYAEAQASYKLTSGERLVIPQINLTGDGVIAGRVVVQPYGTPAVNVIVSACPTNGPPICLDQTQTNGNGWFWIDVPAGTDTVTVTTDLYLANQTTTVTVRTDGFVLVQSIPVYALASIHGLTWALPSGDPIVGANVSLCSPFGIRTGGCFESVPTTANGSFTLSAPQGSYILLAQAPEYNSTTLAVGVTAGALVDVGIVFLDSYGILEGTVVNASDGVAIGGAILTACASYFGGGCSAPSQADSHGAFRFLAPPGSVNLDVVASGYLDNFSVVRVPVGEVLSLGAVGMTPIAAQVQVVVSGRVVEAEAQGVGIGSAFVGVLQGAASAGSTSTSSDGTFMLTIDEGSYSLLVTSAGRRSYDAPFPVSGPISGLVIPLAVMTYQVSGSVTDASDHQPIGGAAISLGGRSLNVTGPTGHYAFDLPNGAYVLTASAVGYEGVSFAVSVNGGPVPHDLTLSRLGVRLGVEVVSQSTGFPLAGAYVVVTTPDGGQTLAQGQTDPGGNFSVYLPATAVLVTVTAAGYEPAEQTVALQGESIGVHLELSTTLSGTSPSLLPGSSLVWWGVLAGAGVAVVLGAGYALSRRRPPEPELLEGRWAGLEPVDEPGESPDR